MHVTDRFKQTPAGEIPTDWDYKTIGDVTDVFVGRDLREDIYSPSPNSGFDYPVFSNTVSAAGLYGFYSSPEYEGDSVTVVGRGVGLGTAFARTGGFGAIGRLLVLFPKSAVTLDTRYLATFINERVKIFTETGGIPQLTGVQFSKYYVALPPPNEQRAIAEALSDLDALLGVLDRMLTKKRDLKQAAMQQLLTGQTRLPGFKSDNVELLPTECGLMPSDWDVCRSGDLITEISMGPFGSDIKVSNFVSEGVPVLSGANVREEKLHDEFHNFVTSKKARSLKKAVAKRGDIVVTHRGTLGQIAFIPNDSEYTHYVISQSQFRVRFSDETAIPHWVVLYFHSEQGAKALLKKKGHSGVPAIAQATTTFRDIPIPLPSLDEQTAIAEVLSDMDAEIAALERRREKTAQLKQGMMQELLTGKTRLV